MDCRDVACNGGALQERSGGTHCNVWGQKASLWPRHSENLKIHPWTICCSNVPVQNSGLYIHSFCHTYLDCMDALSWFPSLSSFCDPAPKKCLCCQHNCLGFSCIWVLCLFSHIFSICAAFLKRSLVFSCFSRFVVHVRSLRTRSPSMSSELGWIRPRKGPCSLSRFQIFPGQTATTSHYRSPRKLLKGPLTNAWVGPEASA